MWEGYTAQVQPRETWGSLLFTLPATSFAVRTCTVPGAVSMAPDTAPHSSAPPPAASEGWCLRHLGNGSFSPEGVYQWRPAVRQRCGFRMHTTHEARNLLRGRHVVFIGNSVQRRTMYALADLLGGDNATRVPSNRLGERIFDQRKGYHDFQHQRIDLADGRSEAPVQGLDYCGVDPVLFECGTVHWGSSPSADEWRDSTTLEGWVIPTLTPSPTLTLTPTLPLTLPLTLTTDPNPNTRWAFLLNASGATTPHAARLARGRVAAVRTALRPFASLALGDKESPMVGPADADIPRVAGTLLLRIVPKLTPTPRAPHRLGRWLKQQLEA